MKYISTNDPSYRANLAEAFGRGLPPGGGYFMPEKIRVIPRAFFNNMGDMSLKDIGYVVMNTLFGEDIPSADIQAIVTEAINFDTPLVADKSDSNLYALQLFHGPSGSYKDFGARIMAHTLRRLYKGNSQLNIIVATTGDAGEAVARSFHGMPGIRVIILYPHSGTGMRQLSSFASLGDNIVPVEVRGTFSQCHDMVKSVFATRDREKLHLFAANSFNLARLLPQTIYYFYAYSKLLRSGADLSRLVITLPSGNLGNLTAGLIAKRMGLPAHKIIAVRTGRPDTFHSFLHNGIHPERDDDTGIPPNFRRLMVLYDGAPERIKADSDSILLSPDEEAEAALRYPELEHFSGAARFALDRLKEESTTRLYLATSTPSEPTTHRVHTAFRPAATLPPSPALFREFLLSHR